MNTKSDWQTVNRKLMEERRRELGAPPTVEQMHAYMRGELSAEEEDRMRELLVCYPELARGLTEPVPEEDARPGEPGHVSDEAMAKRWASLQSRIRHRRGHGRRLGFSRISAAMAATVVLLFGAVLWRAQTTAHVPRIVNAQEEVSVPLTPLTQGGKRGLGSSVETLDDDGQPVLLLVPVDNAEFSKYRMELMRDDPAGSVWSSGDVPLGGENAFRVLLPAGYLKRGNYRLVLNGVDATGPHFLAYYAIRVR